MVRVIQNLLYLKLYFALTLFTSGMCQTKFDFKVRIFKKNYLTTFNKNIKFEYKFESVIQYLFTGLMDMARFQARYITKFLKNYMQQFLYLDQEK